MREDLKRKEIMPTCNLGVTVILPWEFVLKSRDWAISLALAPAVQTQIS